MKQYIYLKLELNIMYHLLFQAELKIDLYLALLNQNQDKLIEYLELRKK